MRLFTILASLSVVLACCATATAGRCSEGEGYLTEDHTWCDDFDQYCLGGAEWLTDGPDWWSGGAVFPERCSVNPLAIEDPNAVYFRQRFEKDPACGGYLQALVSVDPGGRSTTPPMIGQVVNKWAFGTEVSMARFSRSLADRVADLVEGTGALPADANAVNGTDANPLILRFRMDDESNGRFFYSNFYVELSLLGDSAPIDYALVPCIDDEWGPYPVICQRTTGRPLACGPLQAGPQPGGVWASLAVGVLAMMDNDPCHFPASVNHFPTSYHYSVFDGYLWTEIRNNILGGATVAPQTDPPTPIGKRLQCGGATGSNDFSIGGEGTEVHVKITSNKVILYIADKHVDSPWLACFDRQYTGPFDTISFGVGPGCERDPATGECIEDRHCLQYGQPGQDAYYPILIETLSVLGGELAFAEPPPPPEGACCYGNGDCVITDLDTCVNTLGGTYGGNGTTCADIVCCADPAVDGDKDGDVDQNDLAMLQACFTGIGGGVPAGCECFDMDGDNDIDQDDVGTTTTPNTFEGCASGPSIPADPGCDG